MASPDESQKIVGDPFRYMWRREHIGGHRFSRPECVRPCRCFCTIVLMDGVEELRGNWKDEH